MSALTEDVMQVVRAATALEILKARGDITPWDYVLLRFAVNCELDRVLEAWRNRKLKARWN